MYLPYDILYHIATFIVEPKYTLLDWIPKHKINRDRIYKNINAKHYIFSNKTEIDWLYLSYNKSEWAANIIINKIKKDKDFIFNIPIDWVYKNQYAFKELRPNYNFKYACETILTVLSGNPCDNVVEYLIEHPEKINWLWFSTNTNDKAIEYMKQKLDKIKWMWLCANTSPKAIEIIKNNVDKIDWYNLSSNPSAKDLINQNSIKLWHSMSANPMMIDTLKDNFDKIDWYLMSENPAIFHIDNSIYNKDIDIMCSVINKLF